MINILFKNVGQGDTILVEWKIGSVNHFGVIDCNLLKDKNPLLEDIKAKNIRYFDFVIVSHLHFDHYSGFADILEHCISENIKIGHFLHTFTVEYFRILSTILSTQFEEKTTQRFFNAIKKAHSARIFEDIDEVSHNFNSLKLTDSITLSFLAPAGADKLHFSQAQAKYIAKLTTTIPDFNSLSTVIQIEKNNATVLLTSDATIRTFRRIMGKVIKSVGLIQVPHHGSNHNLLPSFWEKLSIIKDCPAIFSVGDVQKDKLPKKSVVEYFDKAEYYNESTNFVHGIEEFYGTSVPVNPLQLAFNIFSTPISLPQPIIQPPNRFQGDRNHVVLG